ncbi:SMC-Scp complex subunit ScpB [Oceanotoga sp. DSM 15011]|uniref:Condensin subunit ScpB n=1 Tax=Oceanotoga teriensis TaxID=515440 RepID=A0AA45HJS5_9BACT|nr:MULTISPECIES: SMC-Scp complex subunit ScpB [Oceanotoga]MDN5342073.1 segregation and condensation protein [Oceanotoga sp.]MDO7975457.1 SMC-Scp complex subunit ScpB [Oceanotoga teriensis]PWJ96255.1 condensin subunit ScpB [Oceanotoga teriensis]UYP00039.1 SMC-Scp complex subunit ScpB [Oceanotoga sp. DSM 15011]
MNINFQLIEAYIYSKPNGCNIEDISKSTGIEIDEVRKIIFDIQTHYMDNSHGVELTKFYDKYRFEIKPEIKKIITPKPKKMNLTDTQFEVITVLFLNGPSRLIEIEKTRGKNSYSQIKKLMEYKIVKKVKRKEKKSYLYQLTDKFYEWVPQETIRKLEEIKDDKFTKSNTNTGD